MYSARDPVRASLPCHRVGTKGWGDWRVVTTAGDTDRYGIGRMDGGGSVEPLA